MWILIALTVGVIYMVDPPSGDTPVDNTVDREYNEIERMYGLE